MNDVVNPNDNEVVLKQSSLLTDDDYDDLGAGIRSALPVLGYRGQRWWLWYAKEELALVDENGNQVPEIGVTLLRVPENPSKRYYAGAYVQGERRRPDCWSDDGVKPHPQASIPVQTDGRAKPTICANCCMDDIGSAVSADKTKRMKACSDYKRIAVKLMYPIHGRTVIGNKWGDMVELEPTGVSELVMLLPIPAGSLTNFKEYGNFLGKHKQHALGRVTFIGFVPGLSFPKLTFRHGPEYDDSTVLQMKALRNSDDAKRVLERDATLENGNGGEPIEESVPVAPAPVKTVTVSVPIPSLTAPAKPTPPVIAPAGRPILKNVTPINTAIAKPTAPPPSARQVVEPDEEQGQSIEEIENELDAEFNALKLDGKTTD
jgi:hypothetical protein